jgi:predicted metal-dependent HD superfamily phosphohydrolase
MTATPTIPLQERFVALWTMAGGTRAADAFADLARCYSEPTRHYHTLDHVRRCLQDLDWARSAIPDAAEVELALWCHDVIYVAGAADNEARSVAWLRHWSAGTIAAAGRVAGLILETTHADVPASLAGRFTADIDLAALGCSRARFQDNGARLRAERTDLDDAAYDAAERAFLRRLLASPRIYVTDLFQARYEAQARANLAWRLAQPVAPEGTTGIRR